ncbi:MAG TPA: hypothetical protein HA263_07925 [Methanoregulaceae archaeon]|nr:hypothetical protein [Methanoregulaceae archaeon]
MTCANPDLCEACGSCTCVVVRPVWRPAVLDVCADQLDAAEASAAREEANS